MEYILLYGGACLKTAATTVCALLEIRETEWMPSDVEITAMETFLDVMHPFVQITKRGEVDYKVSCEATIIQADQHAPCYYYSC